MTAESLEQKVIHFGNGFEQPIRERYGEIHILYYDINRHVLRLNIGVRQDDGSRNFKPIFYMTQEGITKLETDLELNFEDLLTRYKYKESGERRLSLDENEIMIPDSDLIKITAIVRGDNLIGLSKYQEK